jgi:adenosylcobinamide-GDP ribazoletransferase
MNMPPPRTLVQDVAFCIIFFTRLPLPRLDLEGIKLARAIWAAPLAGLVVALLAGIVYACATALGLSTGPAAALAITTTMLTTFCLHEDGFSDTADGFGGGATVDRKLEIMHDSRIGSYGSAAFLVSVLLRWSALTAIGAPSSVVIALIAAHMASRGLLPAFMHIVPLARQAGLAAVAGKPSREVAIAAAALGLTGLLLLGLSTALIAIVILAICFFGFRHLCMKQIGGQTGDTLGALQQIAEIAILLIASAALS